MVVVIKKGENVRVEEDVSTFEYKKNDNTIVIEAPGFIKPVQIDCTEFTVEIRSSLEGYIAYEFLSDEDKKKKELLKKSREEDGKACSAAISVDPLAEVANNIRELIDIQKDSLVDDYMVGLYNGLELSLSTIEKRKCIFKETPLVCEKKENNPLFELESVIEEVCIQHGYSVWGGDLFHLTIKSIHDVKRLSVILVGNNVAGEHRKNIFVAPTVEEMFTSAISYYRSLLEPMETKEAN